MTARVVIQWPDKRLFKTTKDVESEESVIEHAWDLYHTMVTSYGAGLASTQIGECKSVCVISNNYVPSLDPDEKLDKSCVVLVNPKITPLNEEIFEWEEGCLSVPVVKARVKRKNKIQLAYKDLSGKEHIKNISGIESATVQHEVDHLFGKLFIHRLTGFSRDRAMSKLKKTLKKKSEPVEKSVIGRPKRKRPKKNKKFGKNKKK